MTHAAAPVHPDPAAQPPLASLPGCPPFSPSRLENQLTFDTLLRSSVVLLLVSVAVVGSILDQHAPTAMLVMFVLAGFWMGMTAINARVAQQLPALLDAIDEAPDVAEAQLAQALRRLPLKRSVRINLYYRLAVLRHKQQHFAECAAICHTILTQGPALPNTRTHLLLMLTESQLHLDDLWGAFASLNQLHRQPLSLLEMLQTLALQMRYEVECGYDLQALDRLYQKVELAELMPPLQCGAMHMLLAQAAHRAGQAPLAHWLESRAHLLADVEQLRPMLAR